MCLNGLAVDVHLHDLLWRCICMHPSAAQPPTQLAALLLRLLCCCRPACQSPLALAQRVRSIVAAQPLLPSYEWMDGVALQQV